MNATLVLFAWMAPLLVLPLMATRIAVPLTVAAALPALVAAILVPEGFIVEIPWLLLGARLGLDTHAGLFLLFSALLWAVAAAQSGLLKQPQTARVRFRLFFLLAMCGNFGLILGQDLVTFYLGFAVMGLAAYGLVVQDGSVQARRAGRVYLVMTLLAEFLLLFGFIALFWRTGTLTPSASQLAGAGGLELASFITAFGIKAGMLGLHIWLPLAHPAAPVPASAVLSGAMIKTALIGWLRYLPLGQESLPEWGLLLIVAGAAGALLAVPMGLVQRDSKVVLAYSSIGKMGTMICALGVALIEPAAAPALGAAIAFFAAHHGIAKGALFLGVGTVKSVSARWPLWLLAVPALVLAGLPYTSGELAKSQLTVALGSGSEDWSEKLSWLFMMTAMGTAMLLLRFLYLVNGLRPNSRALPIWKFAPWSLLILVLLLLPVGYPAFHGGLLQWAPTLLAVVIAALVLYLRPQFLLKLVGRIPPGDMISGFLYPARLARALFGRLKVAVSGRFLSSLLADFRGLLLQNLAHHTRGYSISRAAAAGFAWLGVALVMLLSIIPWSGA